MTISLGLQSSRKATSRSHPEVTCAPLRNCSLKACLLGLVLFRLLHERLPERSAMPDERGACVCGNREACESVRRSELHLLKRYVAWIRSILSYMDWHPIKHASRHFISNGLSPSYSPVTLSPFPFALCFSYFSPLATMEFAWNRRSGNETFAYDQRRIYGTPTPHSVQGSGPVQTTASA